MIRVAFNHLTYSSPEGAGIGYDGSRTFLGRSSYVTLPDARQKPREAAADLIRPLKTQIQNSGKQPYEVEIVQADAWLAICALSKSLDTDCETTSEVWARAISRTEEWRLT
jgi:hypothetical protein